MRRKPIAWSYSRLSGFETCPKKFFHGYIKKDFKEPESENMRYGKEVHKALELRVRDGTELPLHLRHLEPFAAKLVNIPGEKLTEQQLAITKKLQPTGWFDPDVWCRAILDLIVKPNAETAILIDYKTGNMSDDWTQMRLAGAVYMLHDPNIRKVILSFAWLKHKQMTQKMMSREQLMEVWNEMLPRVKRYTTAHTTEDFPPRPSGLCKRWCPVTTCQHHGGSQ